MPKAVFGKRIPKNEIQTMIIDRSNPDDLVCFIPKDHPGRSEYPDGHVTRLQDLERSLYWHRKDIGMVNLWYADGTHEQLTCEPNKLGKVNWHDCQKYFNKQEQKEIERIAKAIFDVSKKHPAFEKLLSKWVQHD